MTSIDLERACTAATNRGCWLINEVASWNEVLHPYALNLTEFEPGKLALTTFYYCTEKQYDSFTGPPKHYTPSFFITWLPRKHHCVRTLRLRSDFVRWPFPLFGGASGLIDNAGHASNLRKLVYEGNEYAQEAWEAMRASADSLEVVYISNFAVCSEVQTELTALFNRAALRLKKVSIRFTPYYNDMLNALLHCTELTDLTLQSPNRHSMPWTMAELLKQCNKLEKLSIDSRDTQLGCYGSLHESLAANTSLTHLHVVVSSESTLHGVVDAVGYSSSLQLLQLSYPDSGHNCMEEPVGLLLTNNTGLKALILCFFFICDYHSELIAKGLEENSALELLDVKSSGMNAGSLTVLARSLKRNTTLKTLKIGKSSAPLERGALLDVLRAGEGRIEITPWTEDVVSTLAPTLTIREACPRELVLDVSLGFSDETLQCLRTALQETRSVRRLTLHVTGSIGPALGDAVAYLLEDNLITTVELKMNKRTYTCRHLANRSRPIPLRFGSYAPEDAPLLRLDNWYSDILGEIGHVARNRVGNPRCRCDGVCSVAIALRNNLTVTSFEAGDMCLDFPCFDVCKSIARNLSLLSDATRFVTRADVGKRCALAFETLATVPSFREHLSKVTGQSAEESEHAVRGAFAFLVDNFFVITEVVQRSLSCHPGEGTQLDALTGVGFRLVTRHLSVTDVKD